MPRKGEDEGVVLCGILSQFLLRFSHELIERSDVDAFLVGGDDFELALILQQRYQIRLIVLC